jgi:hypothetical protein
VFLVSERFGQPLSFFTKKTNLRVHPNIGSSVAFIMWKENSLSHYIGDAGSRLRA